MPVKKRAAVRENRKPLVFFRGTLLQAAHLMPYEVLEAIMEATENPSEADRQGHYHAVEFKNLLVRHMEAIRYKQQGADRPAHHFVLAPTHFGHVPVKIVYSPKQDRFAVYHYPSIHGVTTGPEMDSFQRLQQILKEGFRGRNPPNVFLWRRRQSSPYAEASRHPDTHGDSYTLELYAPHTIDEPLPEGKSFVKHASPSAILRVNILLNPELSPEQAEHRKKFYKNALANTPLSFLHRPTQPD